MNDTIVTFTDTENNVESRVIKISNGYSVTLKDLDSGEVVPFGRIYTADKVNEAIAYAKTIAQ